MGDRKSFFVKGARIMRFKIIQLLLIFGYILLGENSYSQIADKSLPASFGFSTKSAIVIPELALDSVNISKRIAEDKQKGITNRYGVVQTQEINVREEGVKTENGGTTIWRYEISCPDALSLGVFFKTYNLPEGAAVYLYNSDHSQVLGGFTSENNKDNGELAIAEFRGNSLIVEYDEPEDVSFQGELVIGSISTAYVDFFSESSSSGRIQINCDQGEDWQTQKHAVCRMIFHDSEYSYYCSGALVNNVRKDGTPYFLTANHCISTNSVAETLVTYFNYENSTCSSSDASTSQTLSGATLKAHSSYSDFCLLELSEYPPDEYEPYFAGWDASGTAGSSGVGIHHPAGTPKCIAVENDAPVSYNYIVQWDEGGRTAANTHWSVTFDEGATEGGSSGSPFFNNDKRVIGQLHGGDDTIDLYGKISLSWNHDTTSSSTQLKAWLDPDNTGTSQLDGIGVPIADFKSDVSYACLSTTVYLTDESSNSPTEWLWQIEPETFEYVNETSAASQNPEVIFTAEGDYSVTLIAENVFGSDTITYDNLITAVSTLPVEFVGVDDEITLCGSELNDYEMDADGAKNYSFDISQEDFFDFSVDSNKLTLSLTDEALKYGDFDTYVKVTGTQGNCSASDSVLFHVQMPMNDYVKNAIALKLGDNGSYNNRCGTVETKEPHPDATDCYADDSWCPYSSGSSVLDNSVWFTFKGTSNRSLTIETAGFDSQIAVYEADSYADLLSGSSDSYSLLAANDDASSSETASKIQNLKVYPGKTYWLQVDGKDGDYGDYSISLLSNTIEVFPNPSSGVFHITVSSYNDGLAELSVFSFTGQQILSTSEAITSDANTLDMDLSDLPSGFYILRVNIDGMIMSRKLILSK